MPTFKDLTVVDSVLDLAYWEPEPPRIASSMQLKWHISDCVCGLSDGERHLAHVVKVGRQWFLFDATHGNASGDGFLLLGSYARRQAAMDAAEQAALRLHHFPEGDVVSLH